MMIEPYTKEGKIPIWGVEPDGNPVFTNRINGHFIWDADPEMCESDCDCEEDSENSSDSDDEPEPPSSGRDFCRPPPPPPKKPDKGGRPWVGLHQQQEPEPFWKEKRCAEILREYDNFATSPAIPCMMFTETNYDHQFPPLERRVDPVLNITTKPTISPTEIGPEGRPKPLSQAEEDISRLEKQWKETTFGPASDAKEKEIRTLKAQIHDLDQIIAQKERHLCSFPDPYSFLTAPKLFTPSPFYGPSSKSQTTTSWTLPTATAYRTRKQPEVSTKKEEIADTSPPKSDRGKEVFQDSQDPYSQFTIEPLGIHQEDNTLDNTSENHTSGEDQTDSECSSASTDADPAEISRILMANTSSPTRQEPIYESPDEETESSFNRREPAKPTSGPWFSLDDAPPHLWRDRLIEFGAWLDTQLVKQTDTYKSGWSDVSAYVIRILSVLKSGKRTSTVTDIPILCEPVHGWEISWDQIHLNHPLVFVKGSSDAPWELEGISLDGMRGSSCGTLSEDLSRGSLIIRTVNHDNGCQASKVLMAMGTGCWTVLHQMAQRLDAQISETSTPLISPYNIFRRRRHSLRSITQLITSRRPPEKEYVQSSRLEQCTLVSTQQERVTLLDSSYIQYSNAVIGTVLTTLHAGSVVLTLFPNYNVSLRDSTLSHRLRVQVQLTGAEQVPEALSATLHHQMIYRLQNHAVNLALPTSNDGALFVITDQQEENPSIIHVPRNIFRQELVQMIPVEWVTNYEKLHINKKPIQSTEATFRRSVDGRVVTVFKKLEDEPSSSSSIFQSMMIEPYTKEGKIPIWGVEPDGNPIFTDRINGHFIWDADPEMCESDCDCEEDSENSSDSDDEPEPPSSGRDFCRRRPPPPPKKPDKGGRPWVGLHQQQEPEPFWKEKRCAEILREYDNFATSPAIPCMMFTETNYDHQFPPLERRVDPVLNITTKPTISPTEIGPEGRPKPLSQAEEVLNWQTENAKAQNSILRCIDAKIERLSTHADQSNDRLQHLSDKMQKLLQTTLSGHFSPRKTVEGDHLRTSL
ncbi:Viral movement protein [Vigna unguiculata]|uniref:Viral movement protein n=1 Tax=Vigna unguiculata TaxID=3917 RepID=A0A4D6L6G4_VIGUN|nr:Viral movement protein [Vigna unguiculata]